MTPTLPVKPGYKTTEGLLSLLALILSTLVALKWVPVTVSATLQADAVKAVPLISAGYAIARGVAKHGAHPGLSSWVQSVAAEILPAAPTATTTVTFPEIPAPPAAPPAPPAA